MCSNASKKLHPISHFTMPPTETRGWKAGNEHSRQKALVLTPALQRRGRKENKGLTIYSYLVS